MPRKIREMKADLRRAGFTVEPGKGSYTRWRHRRIPGRITLSGAKATMALPYQEKDVQTALRTLREAERNEE